MSKLDLILIIFVWVLITSTIMLINKFVVATMVISNVMLIACACYLIYKSSTFK